MKKSFTLLLFIFLLRTSTFGQIGVNGSYNLNDASRWKIVNDFNSNNVIADFYENSLSFGIDYWFRLPNHRIEFTPELNYQNTRSEWKSQPVAFNLHSTVFSFFANTNIYIFDIKGDCDCPTFSKKGTELQKGLFLRISPGISYFSQQIKDSNEIKILSNDFAFSIGVGAGLDFGISELMTITPLVTYRYFPSVEWRGISGINTGIKEWEYPEDDSSVSQVYFGLRLGLRFDYQ